MENDLMIPDSKLVQYLDLVGVGKDITAGEKTQFLEIARAYGLNPYKREIYITTYGQGANRQTSILVGYEVYIQRAERSGKLDGYEVTTIGEIPNLTATITINRKDWSKPFTHTVEYSEYVQKRADGNITKFWKEKPKTMLKKVAISQGMRLCFSIDLGGMPYSSEEMPESEPIDVTPKKQAAVEMITKEQLKMFQTLMTKLGINAEEMKKKHNVKSSKELTKEQAMNIIEELLEEEKAKESKEIVEEKEEGFPDF